MTDPPGWPVRREVGSAGTFHARPLPRPARREVAVFEVDRPALVLGSTQADDVVDAVAARAGGVEVVRRRSGGGAVLLEPAAALWVDVVVPAGDELWSDDVGLAFAWLGEAWAGALGALGLAAVVHEGGLCTTTWSRLVCFGGLGPGEVTLGGAKVVGLAQRRTREAARFQCAALLAWAPERLLALLAMDDATRGRAAAELATAAAAVPAASPDLVEAFLAHLPP